MKELVESLLHAKTSEAEAKKVRLKAEAALLSAINPQKPEGSQTTVCDGYKMVVTTKLNRKLDIAAYEALELPDEIGFVDYKPSINLGHLRSLERFDQKSVASCVTISPAKPTIKIEEVV